MIQEQVPAIVVCLSPDFHAPQVLREILCGIEEESVPYQVVVGTDGSEVDLAYQGAEQSPLEVGIGADRDGRIAVHSRQLPPEAPLFRLDSRSDHKRIRSTCSNAARLVKGTPFILGNQ